MVSAPSAQDGIHVAQRIRPTLITLDVEARYGRGPSSVGSTRRRSTTAQIRQYLAGGVVRDLRR